MFLLCMEKYRLKIADKLECKHMIHRLYTCYRNDFVGIGYICFNKSFVSLSYKIKHAF